MRFGIGVPLSARLVLAVVGAGALAALPAPAQSRGERFGAPASVVESLPQAVAVGDFDNDGLRDLAVAVAHV